MGVALQPGQHTAETATYSTVQMASEARMPDRDVRADGLRASSEAVETAPFEA